MSRFLNILKNHWQMIGITTVIYLLWDTDFIQPLRVLIVFLHEVSHALATVLTGGKVVGFAVWSNESGHVMSQGGNRFIILTAGYLGSLLFGILFMMLALRTRWDKVVLGAFGLLMIGVTLLYVRHGYPFVFGLLGGGAMLAIAWFLEARASDLVLRIIGLTSMIYVPFDIFADTIRWSSLRSDARMLAEEFGGTTLLWGAIWLAISLATIWVTLRYGLGGNSNIPLARKARR